MGKSKKRILLKGAEKNQVVLKRNDVIMKIIFAVKNNCVDDEILKYISLFGIQTEELTEFGLTYEELAEIKHVLS